MKVHELQELLFKADQGAEVVVRGYEGGVNSATGVQEVTIHSDINKDVSWEGDHSEHSGIYCWDCQDKPNLSTSKALRILP